MHTLLSSVSPFNLFCLADTGSRFVQISDENFHRVRLLMDEVFRADSRRTRKTIKRHSRTIPNGCFLDGASGLRVGELLGLKWEDVDFKKSVIHIRRSIVSQKIGPPKTEASQKPIPMNAEMAKAL